jgi:hypothetical protein
MGEIVEPKPDGDEPTTQLKLSPAEFTRMLLEGTRAHGLHWKTIEDLFEMAMRQGMPE